MSKLSYFLAATLCSLGAVAASAAVVTNIPVTIERKLFGSGEPGQQGLEQAQAVGDFGVWHVPQYLPGYPSAATIWPRVISVRCKNGKCEGYVITPGTGPGEYLFFMPASD